MDKEKYFLNLDYCPKNLLEVIYKESSQKENYYLSPVNVLRCDVSDNLRQELLKLFSVPFNDCGFLKTLPNSKYPIHKDVFRKAAVNLPLFDFNTNFRSFIVSPKEFIDVNYSKDNFLLLNVLEYHGVTNISTDKERIVLSVGFKDHSYEDLFKLHQEKKFLNVTL